MIRVTAEVPATAGAPRVIRLRSSPNPSRVSVDATAEEGIASTAARRARDRMRGRGLARIPAFVARAPARLDPTGRFGGERPGQLAGRSDHLRRGDDHDPVRRGQRPGTGNV